MYRMCSLGLEIPWRLLEYTLSVTTRPWLLTVTPYQVEISASVSQLVLSVQVGPLVDRYKTSSTSRSVEVMCCGDPEADGSLRGKIKNWCRRCMIEKVTITAGCEVTLVCSPSGLWDDSHIWHQIQNRLPCWTEPIFRNNTRRCRTLYREARVTFRQLGSREEVIMHTIELLHTLSWACRNAFR